MKRMLAVIVCFFLMAGLAQANLLLNGDFESPAQSGAFPDNWNQNALDAWRIEAWAAASGVHGVAFEWWIGDPDDGYLNQDVPVTAGATYTYSLMASIDAGEFTGSYVMDVEWLDGSSASLGTDSLDLSGLLTTAMAPYSFNATAPAGAATARVGLTAVNGHIVLKVDDASFVVPEPTSVALATLSLLGLLAYRRR